MCGCQGCSRLGSVSSRGCGFDSWRLKLLLGLQLAHLSASHARVPGVVGMLGVGVLGVRGFGDCEHSWLIGRQLAHLRHL